MPLRPFLVAAAVGLLTGTAHAIPAYPNQIPNGARFDCNLCHTAGGGTPRNVFGLDVERKLSAGTVDWLAVSRLDSDEDGFTNGEELGDPDGDGTAEAGWNVTDPGRAASRPECLQDDDCAEGEICDGGLCVDDPDGGDTGDTGDGGDTGDAGDTGDTGDDDTVDTGDDDGDDGTGLDDEESSGCTTLTAPAAGLTLALGVLGVLLRRRRTA